MCFMYLFRFIDPYRFQSITVNRFLGDVMILMSPLPLRHVVASQVVKEATEAFLFIGAGDAWRALGQQRLSDLSETSGTPGQRETSWRNKTTPTPRNAFDFWVVLGSREVPRRGLSWSMGMLGCAICCDMLMPRCPGWQEPSVLQSMRTCHLWLFGEIFGTMGVCSLRGGVSLITSTSLHKMYSTEFENGKKSSS